MLRLNKFHNNNNNNNKVISNQGKVQMEIIKKQQMKILNRNKLISRRNKKGLIRINYNNKLNMF